MQADSEGFEYPRIDTHKCVQCGLCADLCERPQKREDAVPVTARAAKTKSGEISSSGGIFTIYLR